MSPTPYFQNEFATIYVGDAREVAPAIPRASTHQICFDPPYGVKFQSGSRKVKFARIAGDEDTTTAREVLEAALPALINKRHVYSFGPDVFDGLPISSKAELIWDKHFMNGGDLSLPFGGAHERINFGVLCRGAGRTVYGATAARLRRGSVLRHKRPSGSGVRRHPTEKPVSLLRELIECSTKHDEVVFDPCGGTLSTVVAAILEGRRALAIELVESNAAIGVERVEAVSAIMRQLRNP